MDVERFFMADTPNGKFFVVLNAARNTGLSPTPKKRVLSLAGFARPL
jgi:hypothetical protein